MVLSTDILILKNATVCDWISRSQKWPFLLQLKEATAQDKHALP